MYEDLPPDIAEEKMEASQIRAHYKKGRMFPMIRTFRALRQRAPGELAKTIFAILLSAAALFVLLRNYEATGLRAVLAIIYFVVIVGLCFWATGVLWRMIGLRARNVMRYLIGNMWTLYFTAIAVIGTIASLFFPHLIPEKESERPAAAKQAPAVVLTPNDATPEVPDEAPAHVPRIFAGEGWRILTDERAMDYVPETIATAHAKCRARGTPWYLAEEKDLEIVGEELVAGGHTGSFWAADRRGNSSLHYDIVGGQAEFAWDLAAEDHTRNVLCVDRDRIGGGVAIIED